MTDASDKVRAALAGPAPFPGGHHIVVGRSDVAALLDECSAAKAEIERLREALQPLAEPRLACPLKVEALPEGHEFRVTVTVGEIRRARAALAREKESKP